MQNDKIPIVIGVTGHRNLVAADIPAIKGYVEDALTEIRNQCGSSTPIIMLNAFAEGADILCAEVAFAMGIDVYALLPCPPERYVKSFDDEAMARALPGYLEKAKRVMVAPDVEKQKDWINRVKEKDNKPPGYQYGFEQPRFVGFVGREAFSASIRLRHRRSRQICVGTKLSLR